MAKKKKAEGTVAGAEPEMWVNGKLSFDAYHDCLGRIFDVLEKEAEWLEAEGLTEEEIEEVIAQAVENHACHSMVIEP